MHPVTNKQVFDSTVQTLLELGRVRGYGQETLGLIESLEHGEGSIETALNLIVYAHVAQLMLHVSRPTDSDSWSQQLEGLEPRIKGALEKCHQIIRQSPSSVGADKSVALWSIAFPNLYDLDPWDDLGKSTVFSEPFNFKTLRDWVSASMWKDGNMPDIVSFLSLYPHQEHTTTWDTYFLTSVVDRLISDGSRLTMEQWGSLIDLFAYLISTSELSDYDYEQDINGTTVHAPPTSTESLLWQFGRVAALGINVEHFDDVEAFEGWSNGLVAMELLLGSGQSVDWIASRCWTAALATWGSKRGNMESSDGDSWFESKVGVPAYPCEFVPLNHLFWLMRLGMLDASRQIEQAGIPGSGQLGNQPGGTEIFMLGNREQLGEEIVRLQEMAEQKRTDQIVSWLEEHLGDIWDKLPEDSQHHLIDAEVNLRKHKPRDASLDYTNAVELALESVLPKPPKQRDWPERLGDWAFEIGKLVDQKRRRPQSESILRQRIDPRYAAKLLDALNVVLKARRPRAHGTDQPPRAYTTREVVLGIQRDSIFELLMKFAQRIPG